MDNTATGSRPLCAGGRGVRWMGGGGVRSVAGGGGGGLKEGNPRDKGGLRFHLGLGYR